MGKKRMWFQHPCWLRDIKLCKVKSMCIVPPMSTMAIKLSSLIDRNQWLQVTTLIHYLSKFPTWIQICVVHELHSQKISNMLMEIVQCICVTLNRQLKDDCTTTWGLVVPQYRFSSTIIFGLHINRYRYDIRSPHDVLADRFRGTPNIHFHSFITR